MTGRSEELGEPRKDRACDCAQEKFECEHDRAATEQGGLWSRCEAYLRGQAQLRVQFSLRSLVSDHCHYLAVFQRSAREVDSVGRQLDAIEAKGVGHRLGGEHEVMVLVDDVQSMKNPQGLSGRVAADVVRLYRVEFLERLVRGTLESDSPCLLCESGRWVACYGGLLDRELSSIIRLVPVGLDELPSKVVERGSEVVDAITEDGGPVGGDWWRMLSGVEVLSSFVVRFSDESVSITVPEPTLPLVLESCQVDVCPRDFLMDAVEADVGNHLS